MDKIRWDSKKRKKFFKKTGPQECTLDLRKMDIQSLQVREYQFFEKMRLESMCAQYQSILIFSSHDGVTFLRKEESKVIHCVVVVIVVVVDF